MKRAKTGRGTPRSGCLTNKVQFDNEARAAEGLERIRNTPKRRRTGQIPIRSYQCELCLQWHLTAQPYDPGRGQR